MKLKTFKNTHTTTNKSKSEIITFHSLKHILEQKVTMPEDIIAPRILLPGDALVLTGVPNIGKSYFLLNWLMHLAAGIDFFGMKPPRPLKIAYLCSEFSGGCGHYLGERINNLRLDESSMSLAEDNIGVYTDVGTLDEQAVDITRRSVLNHFNPKDVDIVAIDPLYAAWDTNISMDRFLKERVGGLRDLINPKAGIMLVHPSDKKRGMGPTEGLHNERELQDFCATAIFMHRPSYDSEDRELIFDMRAGEGLKSKHVIFSEGKWHEARSTKTKD